MSNILRIFGLNSKDERDAYDAGFDCGLNGPNTDNCDFRLFRTPEMTKAWEIGKRDGESERELAKELSKDE